MRIFNKLLVFVVGFSAALGAGQPQGVVKNVSVVTPVVDTKSLPDQNSKAEKFLAQALAAAKDSFIQGVEREGTHEAGRCLSADKVKGIAVSIAGDALTAAKESFVQGVEREDTHEAGRCLPADKVKEIAASIADDALTAAKESFVQGVEREDTHEAGRCLSADKVKGIAASIADDALTVGVKVGIEVAESGKKIAKQGLDIVQNKIDKLDAEKKNETLAATTAVVDNKAPIVGPDSKTIETRSCMASIDHFLRHYSLAIGSVAFVTICAVTIYAYQQYKKDVQDDFDDEEIR